MVNKVIIGKRYEILKKIGAGGMADVYKGKDLMLNRYVAIKILKKEFREDESFVKKFRSEAQAAAGLMNPNIVNVYDVGVDRGLYYMVMELVEGITLKEYILKKRRLSPKEVISIAIQMCNGIGAAHKRQIVHRDIKPQNVIISTDGKVKVTDFGIAKATTSNTVTTSVMGSVHYISPEQARGGYVDTKSDIYSVGITLFEMVTGEIPFDGDSAVEVAMKHIQKDITLPSKLVPSIPYSLEQIILKCTQKNSERRYENIEELIQDLKHSLVDPDGDFVDLAPVRGADTVIITEDDLDSIRNSYDDDDYDDDDYDDDYDDDDYDDDDDDYDYRREGKSYSNKRRDSDEVNPRMNKVIKTMTIVIAIIIVLVIGLVGAKAVGLFHFGSGITAEEGEIEVPDVIGEKEADAIEMLDKAGLDYKIVERKESTKYEAGCVMEQTPGEGERVAKNTVVEIVISNKLVGEELVVPDVSGMTEDEAQKKLRNEGFEKISSEAVYSDEEQGTVIETTPKAKTKATKETEIVMKVSKGTEKITVPNVTGETENDAKAKLKEAGLTVSSVETEYNETVEKGKVISQTPKGGKKVESGTSVKLIVSLGKKPEEKISVPGVVGVSESTARQMINSAGLSVAGTSYEFSSSVPAGNVISCSPGAGESVSKGTGISLVISKGPDGSSGTGGNGGTTGTGGE